MLHEHDELRHPHDDDPVWRESVYFNFDDEQHQLGAWIYLWVVPNEPAPSGMLVSFYRGRWPVLDINDQAMASPGHRIVDGDRWIYCFKRDVDHLMSADFDDAELCGLRIRRTAPLNRYEITFDDGEGTTFDLALRFTTPPHDYATGANPSPSWIATNRYHRSWRGHGTLTVGGETFDLDVSGDSDHSWGKRDRAVFAQHLFKMWSWQTADGEHSVSAVQLEEPATGEQTDLGFVDRDGKMSSIVTISSEAAYDGDGVQRDVRVTIVDELGRETVGELAEMHSHLGSGAPDRFWGWEGVGSFTVDGAHGPGLVSYFWPPSVSAESLGAGGP
jgi:hypothetical protein